MTAPLFDDDPARDADMIAQAARHHRRDPVDECLEHVHGQLVAAAAWDLGERDDHTNDAADEITQQLRRHLLTVDQAVIAEALMLSLWESAHEQAVALHIATRREVGLLEAHINPLPQRTPGQPGAVYGGTVPVPAVCDDPDGHAVEHVDLPGWRQYVELTGLCARCGRIVTRGNRGRQ